MPSLLTNPSEEQSSSRYPKKTRKPWVPPRVKTLTEEDLDKYTIFDVVMPLPGTDVAYPGGKLGERYREFLRLDGLDPENFVRKQRCERWCCTVIILTLQQGVHLEWIISEDPPHAEGTFVVRAAIHRPRCRSRAG